MNLEPMNAASKALESRKIKAKRHVLQKRIAGLKAISLAALITSIAFVMLGALVLSLTLALIAGITLSFSAVFYHDGCKMSSKMQYVRENYWNSVKKVYFKNVKFKEELLKETLFLKHIIR